MNSVRKTSPRAGAFTVLIVCEGENTEPAYFEEFEKYLNKNYTAEYPNGIKFAIYPFPPDEIKIISEESQFFIRKKVKRKIQNFATIINEDIEPEYYSEPVRWVRYAQKKAKKAGYNKVWSIFDYDNRADVEIERAFKLAMNEEKEEDENVAIAFSSYSFEYWLLLHYETVNTYIRGSECKDENNDPIYCGNAGNIHPNNCNGTSCIGGYLRTKGYGVGTFNKTKTSTFPSLELLIKKAKFNAAFIRNQPNNNKVDLWKIKPVTTVDTLIDSLAPTNLFIEWQYNKGEISFSNIVMKWNLTNIGKVNIKILRNNNNAVLIKAGDIKLYDPDYKEYKIDERVYLQANDSFQLAEIDFIIIAMVPKFISIEVNRKIYISEL